MKTSEGVKPEQEFRTTQSYFESDQEIEQNQKIEHRTEPEPIQGGQTFIPSFTLFTNPPSGHSRPFVFQQETAYSQRPGSYRHQQLNQDNSKYNNPYRRENYQDSSYNLLGSGNFGVIRGGTFYNENDDAGSKHYNSARYTYSPFFHNNGHGRPSFHFGATNPRPQQHEQFENFRDFADINAPTNPAYSQYVVVYLKQNGSAVDVDVDENQKTKPPKNIIERLEMLDLETKKAEKKLSPSKRKLALLPLEKKYKVKKSTTTTVTPSTSDLYEPLLALS